MEVLEFLSELDRDISFDRSMVENEKKILEGLFHMMDDHGVKQLNLRIEDGYLKYKFDYGD